MTIYIENPKESKGKTPRIGEFITFTGYMPTLKKKKINPVFMLAINN